MSKFRGKSITNPAIWQYGSNVDVETGDTFKLSFFWKLVEGGWIDPATVGQFTGLLDKNGEEIYEGDILEFWFGAPWDTDVPISVRGKVAFENSCWFFSGFESNEFNGNLSDMGKGTIIGNIYENPKLEAK